MYLVNLHLYHWLLFMRLDKQETSFCRKLLTYTKPLSFFSDIKLSVEIEHLSLTHEGQEVAWLTFSAFRIGAINHDTVLAEQCERS